MNRVNIAWVSPAERRQILWTMAENGIRLVRLSLTPPIAASLDAVHVAHSLGIAVLLEIPLGYPHFYPGTARKRPGFGRVWDMFPLSDVDPEMARTIIRASLAHLDQAGITLAGIELGNEINWAGYNGDLHVYPNGGGPTARSGAGLARRASFEAGLSRYVDLAQVIKEEIVATRYNRHAPLVSAGLATMPHRFADSMGAEYVAPDEVVAMLRARGIDRHVDAYGIHFYVDPRGDKRLDDVRAALALCRSPADGKPCWVTEWGIANASTACPLDDTERARAVSDVRKILNATMAAESLAAALYFEWDGPSPYSVWRCGGLSSAGKAAVAPIRAGD